MKIGSGKPVVGATLVVARSRHQPVFISLCGLHNAMVIAMKTGLCGLPGANPFSMWPDIVIPNAAKRSEESRISRYRSRAIRNTFYFLPLPAVSTPSAVSPDAPRIDKQERLYYAFHKRSHTAQLYKNKANTTKYDGMRHTLENLSDLQSLTLPPLAPLDRSAKPHNFTITREMQQNATKCSTF